MLTPGSITVNGKLFTIIGHAWVTHPPLPRMEEQVTVVGRKIMRLNGKCAG